MKIVVTVKQVPATTATLPSSTPMGRAG